MIYYQELMLDKLFEVQRFAALITIQNNPDLKIVEMISY
jgi:hypothetical protein